MDNPFASLLREFLDEATPMVARISANALHVEQAWAVGSVTEEPIAAMRNDLHTIKGNAGMMGITPVQDAAHALEDLCEFVVENAACRNQAAADLLVDGANLLVDMIRMAEEGEVEPGAATELAVRIRTFVRNSPADDDAEPSQEATPSAGPEDLSKADAAVTRTLEATRAGDASVRIDMPRLEELVELSGDLVVRQAAHVEELKRLISQLGERAELDDVVFNADRLTRSLVTLQSMLLTTRLVPIAGLFARFSRLVRDLSRDLGKKIRLVTEGDATRIDKGVIDGISESLIHVVRNSIDHGLESPEQRIRAGKPEEGTLWIVADLQGDAVVIDVIDDGRGIDAAAVEEKARAMGLDAERLSWRELIFHSGLSTAKRVSKISGRGVGLDVVAEAIRGMGGTIEVDTVPGAGTRFRLRLPLTLTVTSVLLFRSDDSLFAVPVQNVAEALTLDLQQIAEINRSAVVIWRSQSIAIWSVPEFQPFRPSPSSQRRRMIVLTAGRQIRGIAVDAVLGHHSVVLKKLDPLLGDPFGFAGATILGDGRIALVLDVPGIMSQRAGADAVASGERRT